MFVCACTYCKALKKNCFESYFIPRAGHDSHGWRTVIINKGSQGAFNLSECGAQWEILQLPELVH